MLKGLAFAIFLTILLPISGQSQGSPSGNNQSRTDSTANPPLPPATAQCSVKDEGTTIECKWAQAVPDSYFSRLISPENAPNIALVVVGIAGIFVALCTLKKLERQTKATEDAVIQTQRPKIQVRTFHFKHFSDPQEPNGILPGSMLIGQFYIVNLGGTRARVKETHYEFFITGERDLPGERPWEGKGGTKCESIFEAGQSKPFQFGREEPLSPGQAFEIFSGSRRLYLMGWIDYIDGLNIRRTTRFCRLYDPASYRFAAVDDPEYESAD